MSTEDDASQPIDLTVEPPAENPNAAGWKSWVIAAVVAVVMVVGGIVVVGRLGGDDSAAQVGATGGATQGNGSATGGAGQGGGFGGAGFGGGGVFGTLTEVGGDSFVVERTGRSGDATTTKVTVTDATTFTEAKSADLSSVEVGDNVIVMGEAADDGTVAATRIVDNGDRELTLGGNGGGPGGGFQPPADGQLPDNFQPPGDGQLPDNFQPPGDGQLPDGFDPSSGSIPGGVRGAAPTIGKVTANDGQTLTIETNDGSTVTVTVSANTEVTVSVTASMSDLMVGESVQVVGSQDGDTVVAESVQIGASGFGGFGGGFGPGGGPGAAGPGN